MIRFLDEIYTFPHHEVQVNYLMLSIRISVIIFGLIMGIIMARLVYKKIVKNNK